MAYLGEYHINANTKGYYKFDNNLNDSSGAGLTLSSSGTLGYYRLNIGSRSIFNSANNSYLYRNDNYGWDATSDITIGFWFYPKYIYDVSAKKILELRDADYVFGIAAMLAYNTSASTIQIWPRCIGYETPPIEGFTDSASRISLQADVMYFVLMKYRYSGTYDLYMEVYNSQDDLWSAPQWQWSVVSGSNYNVSGKGGRGSTTDYFQLFPSSYSDQFYGFDELFIENRFWTTPSPDFIKYWQNNRAVNRPRCS